MHFFIFVVLNRGFVPYINVAGLVEFKTFLAITPRCFLQNFKHKAAIVQVLEQFEIFWNVGLSLDPLW